MPGYYGPETGAYIGPIEVLVRVFDGRDWEVVHYGETDSLTNDTSSADEAFDDHVAIANTEGYRIVEMVSRINEDSDETVIREFRRD